MKVIKIGGGCLNGKKTIESILDLLATRVKGDMIVVSALNGITDMLIDGMADALADEENIPPLMSRIRTKHMTTARHIITDPDLLRAFTKVFGKSLQRLERYYYGLSYTGESTPKMRDLISSYGERFSAELLSCAMNARGVQAVSRRPQDIGMITDGKYEDATADLEVIRANFREHLSPLFDAGTLVFMPGFYGISLEGNITTYGRGGTDYSAAVATVAMDAEVLEFWKDVAGFMTADPRMVPDAELIPVLSYAEAAELCYFGAKILHPRAVEPVRRYGLDIAIKSTLDPDAEGSLITGSSPEATHVIKSVTQNTDVGIIKVYASGVGARPGMLAEVTGCVTEKGINIKSVVTSQTCISLLLETRDMDRGYALLEKLTPNPFRKVERNDDVALICMVGEGLNTRKGVAARCFSAMDEADINVEMIAFGPSPVALYFIVAAGDLKASVRALHTTFFNGKR